MIILEKVKKYFTENKLFIVISVALIFAISMPLIQERLLCADDYQYHFARIQSITDSLKIGIFPVKIHYSMANGFGYGSGLFYPNFFLYFPAIINLFINNLTLSYKIFIVTILSILYAFNYHSFKSVTKQHKTALLITALVFLSRCLVLNLYDRNALGEFLGFLFIGPIVCGLYNYVYDDFDKPFLLIIGFLGVFNAHLITSFICLIYAIIYFLIHIKTSIRNPKRFLKLIVSAMIVILISAAFWIPMVEQLSVQKYKLSDPWTKIENDEYAPLDLFGVSRYSIGLIYTISTPILFYSLFESQIEKNKKVFIILALIFTFIMLFSPFWKLTASVSNIIQFKWRLIGLTTVLDSISVCIILVYYANKYNINFDVLLVNVIIFAFVLTFINLNTVVDNHELYNNTYLNEILFAGENQIGGGQEYLPLELDYSEHLIEPDVALTNTTERILFQKAGLSGTCKIDPNKNIKSMDIPYIYYLGYSAYIVQDDESIVPLEVTKDSVGLVKVNIPDNVSGTLVVFYNGTKIQKISYLISIFTIIGTCIYIIIKKRKTSK